MPRSSDWFKMVCRYEIPGEYNKHTVAAVNREVREAVEQVLEGIATRYGVVVDVVEPR